MKSIRSLFLLLFVLSLAACGKTPTETPVAADALNLLVVATDNVKLKRESWQDYHTTAFGAVLHRGDQLWPADDAQVAVLCDNLELWHVPAGEPSGLSSGCPQPEEAILRDDGNIGNTRAANDPFIPYIITPRMTDLLTERPRLRWNEVVGASNYTVRIQGLNWEVSVDGTELLYPGNPPLEPGKGYLLIVEADNGRSSSEEETTGLGFVLLSQEEAKSIQAATEKLDALNNLPDEARALARAHLYASHNLMAEAIDTLERLPKNSQKAAIYRLLAELYQQTGLPLLAEKHYMQAISLTEEANDDEGHAAAQAALGEIYISLGNKDEAIDWLSQAKDGYETLGDTERASQLASRLASLKQ